MNETAVTSSAAPHILPVEYFRFEEDFVDDNLRCIPMIIRCKMDIVRIKLPLTAWVRFAPYQKKALAEMPVGTITEVSAYEAYLSRLILNQTGKIADILPVADFEWNQEFEVPGELANKANELGCTITLMQWRALSKLQRFALLKLCRPGHENRNFPLAMKEFGLYEQ